MTEQNYAAMRSAMIASQLRTVGVNDPAVLAALDAVPRERFVPGPRAALAYADTAIPLEAGRALNTPLATARLITEAKIMPTNKVLLVGAATGYTAAVLAELATQVVAVEDNAALRAAASQALADVANVSLTDASLTAGAPDQGPYDVIVIDGAVEALPDAIVAQLKPGGRLATGLVNDGITRLAVGHKSPGGFGLIPFADAACVVLTAFTQPKAFSFS